MSAEFTVRGVEVGFATDDGFADLYGADVGLRDTQAVRTTPARTAPSATRWNSTVPTTTSSNSRTSTASSPSSGRAGSWSGPAPPDCAAPPRATSPPTSTVRCAATGSRLAAVRRYAVSLPKDIARAVEIVDEAVGRELPEGRTRTGLDVDVDVGMIPGRIPKVVFDLQARLAMRRIVDWVDEPVADDAPAEQRRKRPKTSGLYRVGPDLLLERSGQGRGRRPAATPPSPTSCSCTAPSPTPRPAFKQLHGTREWRSICSSATRTGSWPSSTGRSVSPRPRTPSTRRASFLQVHGCIW